jgi:signal recognition particle subunit SRP54
LSVLFKLLKGEGYISEINVAETLKEVRRALLDADVNYKIAKSFTDIVKEKALGQNVLASRSSPVKCLSRSFMMNLPPLWGEMEDINIKPNPAVILVAGLQGSGKTTFSGKLARFLKQKREKIHSLLPVTFTVPLQSNSLRSLVNRLKFLFILKRVTSSLSRL